MAPHTLPSSAHLPRGSASAGAAAAVLSPPSPARGPRVSWLSGAGRGQGGSREGLGPR